MSERNRRSNRHTQQLPLEIAQNTQQDDERRTYSSQSQSYTYQSNDQQRQYQNQYNTVNYMNFGVSGYKSIDKPRRPLSLYIAVIIGFVLLVHSWNNISDIMANAGGSDTSTAYSLGYGIGMLLVLPHEITATIAFAFAAISLVFNARWSALVAGILYAVAIILMLFWFYLVIVQMISCFVAYARMNRYL